MADLPPVVVVAPDLDRDPSTFGDVITELADRPTHLPVRVRYGSRRPRLADLAADILDGLGRVGTRAAVRRTQSADLTLLVPFLLTDATDTLVCFDAGWLGVDGVEDLIAIAAIADHQLWLVLGETPPPELAELLREHCDPWLTLPDATDRWRRSPATGKDAARLRKPVLTGRLSSETARRQVVEGLAGLGPARRRMAEDVYSRATVQPAITVLHAVGLTDENFLRCLRVRVLATDGAELRLKDRTIPVPVRLRRSLARQRLHADVIGPRPGDQLLTFDGSVSRPCAPCLVLTHPRDRPGHTARVPPSRHEIRVRETFPDLDRWGLRIAHPFVPEPGSELSEDDADWQWMPVSQVAFAGMAAARDHLQAVRVHIEAGQYFPFAQQTLIRTAMLAAAQAVWVLAPDDRAERVKNARTFAYENYSKHLVFLRDLQSLAPAPHEGTDAVERHTAQRRGELAARRAVDEQTSLSLTPTDVIPAAVRATWGSREKATESRVEWRRGSGAAHGLPWSVLGRQETRRAGDADADGIVAFKAGASLEALANSYLCAHGLLANAFKLLDQRNRPA